MSDAPTPKKKSPLPIIIALVVVLAGGGFFMMKGKPEAKEEKNVLVMAKEEIPIEEEFLVNMADRATYLRAKISVRTIEGFDKHHFEENIGGIRDAVLRTLRTTSPEDVSTDAKMLALKRKLAAAMNKILGHHEAEGHGSRTLVKKHDPEEIPDGWDSTEGPVVQVFFSNFATQ